jgi:hypothetical protein
MKHQFPDEIYATLARKLRSRIEFIESVSDLQAPTSQIVETVSLQGRKSVETIAFMCLVIMDHSLGQRSIPRDVRSHWNAETVFERLKRKGLQLLPSPSTIRRSSDPQYKLEVIGIPENRLSYDDLISIYRSFHDGLHEPNPYVQADEDEFYTKLLPVLRENISRIKDFIWRHFISIEGRGFLVTLKDTEGKFAVVPLDKIAEVPSPSGTPEGKIVIASEE